MKIKILITLLFMISHISQGMMFEDNKIKKTESLIKRIPKVVIYATCILATPFIHYGYYKKNIVCMSLGITSMAYNITLYIEKSKQSYADRVEKKNYL